MPRIEFIGVGKVYPDGTRAVRDLNLSIEDHEFLCVLGPSGCGKSSTLRMLAGLESVTTGDILVAGQRVNDVAPQKRDAAMVFENYALYPHLSVFDNLAMPLTVRGLSKAEISAKVTDVAALLKIGDLLSRRPARLSGGERQRVGIGRAMVRQPRMFLMDEPLGHLEAYLRVELRAEVRRVHERLSVTTMYITHDQEEAAAVSDRIAVMWDGRLQQVGVLDEFLNAPANRFVGEFVGDLPMNFLGATPVEENGTLCLRLGDLRLAPTDAQVAALRGRAGDGVPQIDVGLRPRELSLKPQAGPSTVPGRVVVLEPQGETTVVLAQTDHGARLSCVVPSAEVPEPGEVVHISIDMAHAHLFDASGANLVRRKA